MVAVVVADRRGRSLVVEAVGRRSFGGGDGGGALMSPPMAPVDPDGESAGDEDDRESQSEGGDQQQRLNARHHVRAAADGPTAPRCRLPGRHPRRNNRHGRAARLRRGRLSLLSRPDEGQQVGLADQADEAR